MTATSFLSLPANRQLAYHLSDGSGPAVLFLGGFKSDMTGSKATALEAHCRARGQRFIRFDYTGHGQSSGKFEDGTIGAWKNDALAIIDALGTERMILVGSSMGAWISLLCALERKEKITAFVGIASAPDFTENLIWEKLSNAQKNELEMNGVFYAPSCYGEAPYPITKKLIEEARNHLLLRSDIALDIPICLIHGMNDEDVPWQTSITLMEKLRSSDVRIQLVKGGNHRMSEPEQLELLCEMVDSLL